MYSVYSSEVILVYCGRWRVGLLIKKSRLLR